MPMMFLKPKADADPPQRVVAPAGGLRWLAPTPTGGAVSGLLASLHSGWADQNHWDDAENWID